MSDDIPSYNPQSTEAYDDIPERFIAAGYLELSANGTWLIKGGEITNTKMRSFLFRHLMRTAEGDYWVVNGPQRVPVEIEDTPYFVTAITAGRAGLQASICDGTSELLDLEALWVNDNDVIYTDVKRGCAGAPANVTHRARLTRAAVIDLGQWLRETETGFAIAVDGKQYPIRNCT